MKRFYRLASPDEERVDYARGEGVLESSGSEDEDSEVEEDELELGGKRKVRYMPSDSEPEEEEEGMVNLSESDDEGGLRVNLSEDEEPEMEEDDEEEEEGVDPTTRIAAVNLDWDHLQAADLFTIFNSFLKPQVKRGEAAPPPPGKLLSVRIYPSEFGKERMADEDAAGPGGGLWKADKPTKGKKSKRDDSDEDSDDESGDDEGDDEEFEGFDEESGSEAEQAEEDEEEEGEGEEGADDDEAELADDGLDPDLDDLEIMSDVSNEENIDMDQLRKYQLERLRYYYAIATFSTVAAAELVHNELNGTEFERTANILDLSYVPEGMEFEESEVQ
jgi:hypothetical protein